MVSKSLSIPAELWPRIRVETWSRFQEEIEQHLDGDWLFRGVSSARHELVPSIGRRNGELDFSSREREILAQFRREALPLLQIRPVDDWEWLALAQHYGIPTRLLDWSESPYVSLFFAVWGNNDEDAGLYVVPRPEKVQNLGLDPFALEEISFFYPGYVTPRLVSQRGLFTIHPDPEAIYKPPGIKQIILDKSIKQDFRKKLDTLGVHHAAIFPDLDGLSRRLVAVQGFRLGKGAPPEARPPETAGTPVSRLVSQAETPPKLKINPRDPQKGQWGQSPSRNGWSLTATVKLIEADWFQTDLLVGSTAATGTKLTAPVTFYLHDSFRKPVRPVSPRNGDARLRVWSYGAFTVGVAIEQDGTTLELDLSELQDAPKRFRAQ